MTTPPRETQLPPVAAAANPKDVGTVAEIGMSGARLSIGAMLGPYRIDEHIGSGGMGIVYKARDTRLERNVAIKVIPARISSPVLETALLREAQLTSSLSHPGIVTIYDILFLGGTTCIVMEFVQGQPLEQLIPEGGLAVDRALSMSTLIGNAIAAAHAAGVVHRDLKPANILVRDDGQIRILDFGLAKVSRPFSPDAQTQAMSIFGGLTVGTMGYMAPEQARGEDVDERADIFSFGLILYQLLTGRLPLPWHQRCGSAARNAAKRSRPDGRCEAEDFRTARISYAPRSGQKGSRSIPDDPGDADGFERCIWYF